MRRFVPFPLLTLFTFSIGIALKSIWRLNPALPEIAASESAPTCNLLFLEEEYPGYKEIRDFKKQKQNLLA
jgi:hypothetical protein